MKSITFWKFLMLMLMTVCLFGCEQAHNVINDIAVDSPSSDSSGTSQVDGEVPVTTEEKPSDAVDQTSGAEVSSDADDIEELLARIKALGEEIEAANTNNAGIGSNEESTEVGYAERDREPPIRDNDPPEITDSSIEDGTEGVGRNNVIWIQFNEFIVDGDLTLRIKGGAIVETRVNYGTETIHLERLGTNIVMKPLTTYVVEGTVSDAAGNETDVKITFTTSESNF